MKSRSDGSILVLEGRLFSMRMEGAKGGIWKKKDDQAYKAYKALTHHQWMSAITLHSLVVNKLVESTRFWGGGATQQKKLYHHANACSTNAVKQPLGRATPSSPDTHASSQVC